MSSSHLHRSVGVLAVFAAAGLASTVALGQTQILEIYGPSLTTYQPTGATAVQSIRPLSYGEQRGVTIDGSVRAGSAFGWALNGNSVGGGGGGARLGDIRLDTLGYAPTKVDIALPAPGFSFVVGRTFNGQQESSAGTHRDSNGYQGKNWQQLAQPEIVLFAGATSDLDVLYIMYGADRYVEFQRTGAGTNFFKGKNGAAGIVEFSANSSGEPETYTYTDQRGVAVTFLGFDGDAGSATGQFWKQTDVAGNVMYVGSTTLSSAVSAGYTSGKIATAYDSADRRYTFAYTTLDSVARLTQVKAEIRTGGTWASPSGVTEVARVDYDYYGTAVYVDYRFGDNGTLRLVTVTTPMSDGGVNLVKKTHYRYGTGASANQVTCVVDAEGYRRADWAGDNDLDDTPLTMSTGDLIAYSALSLEYDSSQRVTEAVFNGECGCSGGADGTYAFARETASGYSSGITNTSYASGWATRTVITQPDGLWVTQYFDETGQTLSRLRTEKNPASSPEMIELTQVTRESTYGTVTEVITPPRRGSFDLSTGAATTSSAANTGASEYVRSARSVPQVETTGDLKAMPIGSKLQESNVVGEAENYTGFTLLTSRSYTPTSGPTVVRPFAEAQRSYKATTTDKDTGGTYDATTLSYTYWSATATSREVLAPKSVTVTMPVVATADNGSNSATARKSYLRKDGTTAFSVDPLEVVTYTAYNSNGQVSKTITDAQTNHGSDFASGDDPNTDFGITESGSGERLITTYTYDHQGRIDTVTRPDGTVTKSYYTVLADGRQVTVSIPKMTTGGSTTYYGPTSFSVTNHSGKAEVSGTFAVNGGTTTTALSSWVDEGEWSPFEAFSSGVGYLYRVGAQIYNESGGQVTESRSYFANVTSGMGTEGTHYDATTFGYDSMGRRIRTESADGTISRTVYVRGRATESWVGTDDTGLPGGMVGGTSNMTKISVTEYDNGNTDGKANGWVTKVTQDPDGDWDSDAEADDDQRVTEYKHDARGRVVATINPQAPHSVVAYDHLGRVTSAAGYSSSSGLSATSVPTATTNRVSLSKTYYDALGRAWKTSTHKIDLADGSDDDSLTSYTWWDAAGRVIKTKSAGGGGGGIQKTAYDRLGRATNRYVIASDGAETAYADMDDVTGDTVLEESQTYYETATGHALMSVQISRHHDDSSTTGALDTDADLSLVNFADSKIKGRASISCTWYDALHRPTDTVALGTNGGSNYDRDGQSVPARSDTALVTTVAYDDAGNAYETTDPMNRKARTVTDYAGRTTATIANYEGASAPIATANRDNDVYTRRVYVNGHQTKLWVDLDGDNTEDADDQVTTYTYGVVKGSSAGQSNLAHGGLLQKVAYPDSSGGSDVVSYAYNALAQMMWQSDQMGTITVMVFDASGRVTEKQLTALGSGIDGAVRRIGTTYDTKGRVEKVTQYDAASGGSVVDEVKYTYDTWGQVSNFEQDPDSAVGTGTAYAVGYGYTKRSPSGGWETLALETMTLPGSSEVTFDFGSGTDSNISRVASVAQKVGAGAKVEVASYQYLGLGQLVGVTYPEPGTDVTYLAYDVGSPTAYGNLDRFGRRTRDLWSGGGIPGGEIHDVTVAYDRNSNIASTDEALATGLAGEYPAKRDAKFTMDELNRLMRAQEGTLSSGSISSTYRDERWQDGSGNLALSQTGNWTRRRLDVSGDGDFTDTDELDDAGTFNVANEWLTRDLDNNSGTSGNNFTLAYDAAGNMTDDGRSYEYVWDGFGRLRQVKRTDNQALIAEYRYNGLGYRLSWKYDTDGDSDVDGSDQTYFFVYDLKWRPVATYRGTDANPKERFIFHNAGLGGRGGSSYIDAVIMRDRDANAGWTAASDATLEERRYYCQNWRADVVALLESDGDVSEWVRYSAYGEATVYPFVNGDYDGSGSVDGDDVIAFYADWDLSANAADVNRADGVDGDDVTAFFASYNNGYMSTAWTSGGGLPANAGQLSVTSGNRIGYAGYQFDPATEQYHVRHRVYSPEMGRWTRRDPIGYVDGMGLYGYGRSQPLKQRDSTGMYSCPSGSGNQRHDPTSPCDECCTKACDALGFGVAGATVCCGSHTTTCVCGWHIERRHRSSQCFQDLYEAIIRRHEDIHKKDMDCSGNTDGSLISPGKDFGPNGEAIPDRALPWKGDDPCIASNSEVRAWQDTLAKLNALDCSECDSRGTLGYGSCKSERDQAITNAEEKLAIYLAEFILCTKRQSAKTPVAE